PASTPPQHSCRLLRRWAPDGRSGRMMMTSMVKAVALVAGLGAASGAATVGVRPMTLLLDLHRGIEEMQLTKEQEAGIRGVLRSHSSEVRRAADRVWHARLAVHEAVRQEPL